MGSAEIPAPFDTAGNAHIAGILFDITSPASAFIAMKSNAGIDGAFYHSPKPGPFQTFSNTPVGVIASDNDPNIAHDKEFIVADSQAGSWQRFWESSSSRMIANNGF